MEAYRLPTSSPSSSMVYPFLASTGGVLFVGTMALLPFLVIPWLPRKIFGALPCKSLALEVLLLLLII